MHLAVSKAFNDFRDRKDVLKALEVAYNGDMPEWYYSNFKIKDWKVLQVPYVSTLFLFVKGTCDCFKEELPDGTISEGAVHVSLKGVNIPYPTLNELDLYFSYPEIFS